VEGTWRYDDDVPVHAKGPYDLRWTRDIHSGQRELDELRYLKRLLQEQEAEKERLLNKIVEFEARFPSSAEHGFLGLSCVEKDGALLVDDVLPDGPADRAHIKRGDRILAVEGVPVKTDDDLGKRLQKRTKGEDITLRIDRDGWRQD